MPHSTRPYGFPSAVLDHASSMLAFWDKNLICRYANRAYEQWFGVKPEVLNGTSIRDLLGPTLFALNEPYIRNALAGHTQIFERAVPGPDGIVRHSLARYTPDIVAGEVVGFIAEVTEVTSLKQAQSALEASVASCEWAYDLLKKKEADLEIAQQLGKIGSWHWEIATDVATWSAQLYRIFGLDASRLPPTYADNEKLYSPASWITLQAAIQCAVSDGTPFCLELDFNMSDGLTGVLEVCGSAERDEDDRIIGLHGTAQDITERCRAQSQRQTDLARRALEDSERRTTDFLAVFGHEVRNSLAPISLAVELIRRLKTKDTVDRETRSIASNVRHIARLVDDLFEITNLQRGDYSLTRAKLNIAHVIDSAIEMSRESILRHANVLETGRANADLIIEGDDIRLTQVLSNLLNNAAKFTTNGLIRITAQACDDGFAEIKIVDSGIGIAPHEQESIFGLYVRATTGRDNRVEGFGIGLHIVKRLVELHGGTVHAYSAGLQQGSTFTVRLPLA